MKSVIVSSSLGSCAAARRRREGTISWSGRGGLGLQLSKPAKRLHHDPLIHDHMPIEEAPIVAPARLVEGAVRSPAFCRGVSHEQRMMGVVVDEQPLPAKRQQPLDLFQPSVEQSEVTLEADTVDRIGLRQAPDSYPADRRPDRQPCARDSFASWPKASSDSAHTSPSKEQGSSAQRTVASGGSITPL